MRFLAPTRACQELEEAVHALLLAQRLLGKR